MSDHDRPGSGRDERQESGNTTGDSSTEETVTDPTPATGESAGGSGETPPSEGDASEPAPKPAQTRSNAGPWVAVLILAAAVGAGAFFGLQELRDLQTELRDANQDLRGEIDTVRDQRDGDWAEIESLAERLDETAEAAEQARAERTQLEERLEERLDTLVDERIGAFTERVDELVDDRVDTFRSELEALDERIAGLDERQAQLLNTLDEVAERADAQSDNWVQAEAAYLAQVAVHRIRHHRDRDSALAALQSADRLLSEIGGEGIPGRSSVRDAVDALLAWSPVDRTVLADRLDSIQRGIDEWTIRDRREEPGPIDLSDGAEPDELGGWQGALARGWERLRDGLGELIQVHRDDDVRPYLPPEQRYFLRENVRLQLETAQGALFRENARQWNRSLTQAIEWIEGHFETDDEDVAGALETLRELRDTDIEDAPPEIAEHLESLTPLQEAR